MSEQPTLETSRLILRPFLPADAAAVQTLAGAPEIADTTLHVPHPYPDGAAETWIRTHAPAWHAGTFATYALTDRENGTLIGAISLTIASAHVSGELGYWVGRPYWTRGYCTEAGHAMLELGFGALGLHRIQARHLTRNPASGRVLQKLGMKFEGIHRECWRKQGRFEDIAFHAILAREWTKI